MYVIVAGIAAEKTSLSLVPIDAYVVLVALLAVLFNVEGLEISATEMFKVDLDEKTKIRYPAASKLHKLLRNNDNLRSFLIGRQLLVISLVFIIAGLTASDVDHLPLIGIKNPPLLSLIFFKLGLAGAFITFWFGQISAKLLASQQPIKFLNLPFQIIFVRFTILVGKSGLAYPAELLLGKNYVAIPVTSINRCCHLSNPYSNYFYRQCSFQ